jgi:hypothetical protein
MHYNDDHDSIPIQSLKSPRELPVSLRPSAEQAVKVLLQPLQGSARAHNAHSGDSAKQ